MITINNLKKTFRKYTILDIDNLVIGDNEKVAIVGKNGVGKTTLCEIIMGTQAPTSGKIETSIDDLRKNAVFQETGFSNDVNIYSIAKFYQDIFRARDFDLKRWRQRASRTCEKGISLRWNHYIDKHY
jgi:ABC-type multidrug transport system ATPase subunit